MLDVKTIAMELCVKWIVLLIVPMDAHSGMENVMDAKADTGVTNVKKTAVHFASMIHVTRVMVYVLNVKPTILDSCVIKHATITVKMDVLSYQDIVKFVKLAFGVFSVILDAGIAKMIPVQKTLGHVRCANRGIGEVNVPLNVQATVYRKAVSKMMVNVFHVLVGSGVKAVNLPVLSTVVDLGVVTERLQDVKVVHQNSMEKLAASPVLTDVRNVEE